MSKRILLTGGSGFLGRQIVEQARSKGYTILAPRSTELNLETLEGADSYLSNVIKKEGPIDVMIHSAAHYGGIGIINAEPATVFQRNVQMGLNAFELCRKYNIKKIIPIGSACSYPGYLQGDLKEENFWDGKLHESVEAYGFCKKVLLVAQKAYYKQYKIESNHLVLTNLYGPHDVFTEYRSHVLAALIKKFTDAKGKVGLWGDGTPVREFIYVGDAAEAIVRSVELAHDPEPINIGTGVGTTIKELALLIAKYSNFKGEINWDTSKPNGAVRKVLDVKRMKEKLGWEPKFSLEDGIKETFAWYMPNKAEADARV